MIKELKLKNLFFKTMIFNLITKAVLPFLLVFIGSNLSDSKIGSMKKVMATKRASYEYYIYKNFVAPRSL